MPVRIMSWNIQDLGLTKFQYAVADPRLDRANYIIDTIVQVDPDILVVVEVESGMQDARAGRGFVVAESSGGPAVRMMLSELRLRQPVEQWCLVPPLLSGTSGVKEGVAVFFKNRVVDFRGPQQVDTVTLGNKQFQCAGGVAGGANEAYLEPWDWVLPNTVPGGLAIGAPARRQNQLCGKPYFARPGGQFISLDFPYENNRSPFLTEFREIGGAQPRTIKVLGCHLPPHTEQAGQAISNIMCIREVVEPLTANEVRIICGDFNVNFSDPGKLGYWNTITMTPIPIPGGGVTHYSALHPITPSEYKRVAYASLAGGPTNFDVVSTGWDFNAQTYRNPGMLQALDGIFGVFGTGAAPGLTGHVINRVANTPYVTPLPPGGIPEAMARPLATQLADRALVPPPVPSPDAVFRRMENFGKIRGASDHMPVYGDV